MGLGLVFIPPIVGGITLILKNTGPLVALYLYFFILVLSLFMLTIYPVVIAPLFNKFTPLPQGPLRYRSTLNEQEITSQGYCGSVTQHE